MPVRPQTPRLGPLACPGWWFAVDACDDLATALWTTAEAAEACGVTADVIYQWKRRGKIRPVNAKGWPRYRALDVLAAEAATRERARRTYAA